MLNLIILCPIGHTLGPTEARRPEFTLTPEKGQTKIDVLNKMLEQAFAD